jgi:hypothetical protein
MVTPRYYIASDTYHYSTCNRPLVDLTTNVVSLAYYLDLINQGRQATVCTGQGVANALNPVSSQFSSISVPPDGTTLTFPVAAGNTGPTTLALNDNAPSPLVSVAGPLQGAELTAGDWIIVAWTGSEWLLLAKEAGAFPTGPGLGSNQAVILGQLQDGSMSLSLSSVATTEYSGATLVAEEVYVADAATPGDLVNFSQLISGVAGSSSVIDWTNVSSDAVLEVGQTAYYAPVGTFSSVPLHIACADNQIYELDVYQLPPYVNFVSGDGLAIGITPNNNTYSGAFVNSELESASTNQGQVYEPISATAAYGVQVASEPSSSFYIDDVGGSAIPPYQRNIKIYTGSTTLKVPKVLCSIGGGGNTPAASGLNSTTGTNITGNVWDDTTTPYASLGTISCGPAVTWIVFVRRVF